MGKFFSLYLLALILLASALFMVGAASQESAIMDELAHIPSGYGYARFLDFRLNPEHPPLIKALSALPLLFLDLRFPLDYPSWTSDVNGQWDAGNQFLYQVNDRRADTIIFFSRIFPILLTLLLIAFVFFWARELLGSWWALLPALFVGFSPHILAHGHYVTTDVGATLGFFIGLYFFVRFLSYQSTKHLIWAGVFFGIAQLMKFSIVLLIPLFLFLAFAHWWMSAKERGFVLFSRAAFAMLWKYVKFLLFIFIIGGVVISSVYVLFTLQYPPERQRSDTEFILGSFAGGSSSLSLACPLSLRCLAEVTIWMSDKPILRGPAQYMLGVLMVMQRSSGGNTAYFLGDVSAAGWWYYFPVVFFLKESLPALFLLAVGFFAGVWRYIKGFVERRKHRFLRYLQLNFAEFSMLSLIVLYWIYSIQSPLNIGFRHILPTIPFLYIVAASSLRKWCARKDWLSSFSFFGIRGMLKNAFLTSARFIGVLLLVFWLVGETVFAYPYFLSYFNQFGGGVEGGYKYVTDSNYDWGQDMIRLKEFVTEQNIEKIAVDYFGGADVKYYLGDGAVLWNSAKGDPREENIEWLAVSINTLQSAKANSADGFERAQKDSYPWLLDYESPTAKVGTSIFVYRLD